MSNLKISQLNAADALAGTELIECAQGGANVATTPDALKTYIGGTLQRRYDSADPYAYLGTAPTGVAESATGWTLTRIELAADGTVVATLTASDSWDNHLTATYA